jgi:hypothetical protein
MVGCPGNLNGPDVFRLSRVLRFFTGPRKQKMIYGDMRGNPGTLNVCLEVCPAGGFDVVSEHRQGTVH